MNFAYLLLPVGIGLLFAAVHYWSSMLHAIAGAQRFREILAGVTAAYVFLQLYPQTVLADEAAGYGPVRAFLLIGIGFVVTHSIAQLTSTEKRELHPALFAVLQLSIGLLATLFLSFNTVQGLLFIGWALLISTITNGSLHAADIGNRMAMRVGLSATTLIGVLTSAFFDINVGWLIMLQGMLAGLLTALLMRELQRTQKPWFFAVGAVAATIALLLL